MAHHRQIAGHAVAAQRQIEVAFVHHLEQAIERGFHERERRVRRAPREQLDGMRDQGLGNRHHGAESHVARRAGGQRGDVAPRQFYLPQNLAPAFDQHASYARQLDGIAHPAHDRRAQRLLDLRDLLRDGRLRDVERCGHPRDLTQFAQRDQNAQMPKLQATAEKALYRIVGGGAGGHVGNGRAGECAAIVRWRNAPIITKW
ncbi:hypothetical protein D9M68_688930 [compost metagenome]